MAFKIIDFYQKNHVTKKTPIYVIGGGILQDLGAFSAKMYKRGISWIYIPTTLLSQSDSCCGAKPLLIMKTKPFRFGSAKKSVD